MSATVKRPSLVEEVRRGLLDDLVAGKLETGAKLPNENDLAEQFGVSRATVREAVLGLMEAGYVARRHGSGTFVTGAPRGRHALDTTVSYNEMIREAGHVPTQNVISKATREPTEYERKVLRLGNDGDEVLEIERVRLADRRPVIYSLDLMPASLVGDIASDRLDSSLYVILGRVGHEIQRGCARLVPTVASAKLARILEVRRGTPLLHIDEVDYDARGRAILLSLEWHVGDAFEIIVNRRPSPTA